jgi:sulfur dioxygenase
MAKVFAGAQVVAGLPTVSVQDVLAKRAEVQLVDVREPAEWNDPLGHVAGATLVPLSGWPAAASKIDLTRPVVCLCKAGGRSARAAAELLRVAPQAEVYNMAGGMMAWHGARQPVERG